MLVLPPRNHSAKIGPLRMSKLNRWWSGTQRLCQCKSSAICAMHKPRHVHQQTATSTNA